MKISFKENFYSLSKDEVNYFIHSNYYIPIVMIPNLGHDNEDAVFDVRDVFFVPKYALKVFDNSTDKKYCYILPPSDYSDVIIIDKDYGEYLWNHYSRYNPSESYKEVYKVLNFSVIFKVLSPAIINKLQIIIDEERQRLGTTIQLITNHPNYK